MSFAFVHCLPGLEALAKGDVAARHPGWRLSYSRPGLLTYKHDDALPTAQPPTYFARVFGASHGQVAGPDALAAELAKLEAPAVVHVYPRSAEELDADALAPWLAAAHGCHARVNVAASDGERVVDVVLDSADRAWLGSHLQGTLAAPLPAGAFDVALPADMPSRAYGKAVEAIAWRQLAVEVGQTALEIGSSPGGAALALAQRGVTVWGVDSAAMYPEVLAYRHASGAQVHHVAKKVGAVRWEELPPQVDWLLVDVNLAPQVAVHSVARLVPRVKKTLRGAIVTLKMNDAHSVATVDELLRRIADWGLPDVRCRHLPSNRSELCVVALPAAR